MIQQHCIVVVVGFDWLRPSLLWVYCIEGGDCMESGQQHVTNWSIFDSWSICEQRSIIVVITRRVCHTFFGIDRHSSYERKYRVCLTIFSIGRELRLSSMGARKIHQRLCGGSCHSLEIDDSHIREHHWIYSVQRLVADAVAAVALAEFWTVICRILPSIRVIFCAVAAALSMWLMAR